MKTIGLVLLAVLFSFSAFASSAPPVKRKMASTEIKCEDPKNPGPGIDPDFIEKQVKAATSCYDATIIVEACGAGSAIDNMTTSAAIEVCDKFTGKLNKSDIALKKSMNDRCVKICNAKKDGSMCLSEMAFCMLSVSKFMNSVNGNN